MARFTKRTPIPVPADRLFAWHARPGAFERLQPPWARVRLVSTEGIADGCRAVLELRAGPFRSRWVARHRDYVEGRQFADVQESGPFAAWAHTHRFVPDGPAASLLEDEVDYRLPGGALGRLAGERLAARMLARTFDFRHERTLADLVRHGAYPGPALRIAVSGASGLVGRSLTAFLTTGGHRVDTLVRRSPTGGTTEIGWNPERGEIDAYSLEGVDAVVHLADEPLDGRWTLARKEAVLESRRRGTALLAETLAGLERKPSVLVSASTIGVYGDRGDETLTEESEPGSGFLAEAVGVWEAAADPARAAGVRVVSLRVGVVLDSVLPRLATQFRLGAGGPIGSGRQYLSWITLDDVVGAFLHAIRTRDLAGPVNAVSPAPARNADVARTLARVLHRPAAVRAPEGVAKLALGGLAEPLLASRRVEPRRLEQSGFRFLHAELEQALRHELGR